MRLLLSSNDHKRIQSINSIETYTCEMSKDSVINHNPNCAEIPSDPYRLWIIEGSRSVKTNALRNLTNHQSDIDKMYLYAKDPHEAKYISY